MITRLNFLYQVAFYDKPEEKTELKRLIEKAARWQRITDSELKYIETLEKDLIG